jgi:hypothetical protein
MSKGTIQAAINGQKKYSKFAYFFKNDQYIKYDWVKDAVSDGYPAPLSAWNFPGKFARGVDAAVNGSGSSAGKSYFFKDDEYLRYDWDADAVDPGYPQPLSLWNFPAPFSGGIDAAVEGIGEHAGKVYFFKGDQYLRYDLEKDVMDSGYPLALSAWKLPGNMNNGIDAALNGLEAYKGKVYFFKDDQYVRYDWGKDSPDDSTTTNVNAWGINFGKSPGSADTDGEGFRLRDSGSWNSSAQLAYKGGQVMHFRVTNLNVLGTTISINSNLGGKKSIIILPTQTVDLRFDCFGSEPMGWTFDVSTESDAFLVSWKLYASWLPGDPPNK